MTMYHIMAPGTKTINNIFIFLIWLYVKLHSANEDKQNNQNFLFIILTFILIIIAPVRILKLEK